MVDVSIIIINWNTKKLLQDCLKSVYEQSGDIEYEIIVVDNASTDRSKEMVRSDFPDVVLIENKENRGFAAANNQGIAVARRCRLPGIKSRQVIAADVFYVPFGFEYVFVKYLSIQIVSEKQIFRTRTNDMVGQKRCAGSGCCHGILYAGPAGGD
jgi:glycosyltransferase involved in cell wall biosynthesis